MTAPRRRADDGPGLYLGPALAIPLAILAWTILLGILFARL